MARAAKDIALAAHDLFQVTGNAAHEASCRLAQILADVPVVVVFAVDRLFRDRRAQSVLGVERLGIDAETLQRLLGTIDGRFVEATCVAAAFVRDGWARQVAVDRLAKYCTPMAVAALLTRLNDPVPNVAVAARTAVEPMIVANNVALLAQCLWVAERLAETVRGRHAPARGRIRELLVADAAGLRALEQQSLSRNTDMRFAACRLLMEHYAGHERVVVPLERALDDHNPRTRHWAAEMIANGRVTPESVQGALVPRMSADPSPALRLVALRLNNRRGNVTAIRRAALDGNANVRFYARRFRLRRGDGFDVRSDALARCADPTASARELVGAIAALSDVGRAQDVALVRRFSSDSRSRVAYEAKRTMAMLTG